MRWIERLGELEIEVSAEPQDRNYAVVVRSSSLTSSPILVDTHWGREAAARIALDILHGAWKDQRRFLAEEREEARAMPAGEGETHVGRAVRTADEARGFGPLLEEAISEAIESPSPSVDIQRKMDEFYEIVEVGREMAIQGLMDDGLSLEEAREELTERSLREFKNKWRLVPARRYPQAGSWTPR